MAHQFSFERVHVHIMELLDSLLQAPHIKVIEPSLPEARQRGVALLKIQRQLPSIRLALSAQAARDALLQHLNHSRRRSSGRLTDEQVDMLGHNHVTHQREAETFPYLVQDLDEDGSGAGRAQQWQATITRERNEVQMAVPIVTDELSSHEGKAQNPDPLKPQGSATRKSNSTTSVTRR